jgi:FAD/FMN-containing dehydrogenase
MAWLAPTAKYGWKAVVDFAPEAGKRALDLWPSPSGDFEIMRRVKSLFDPSNLLNRGRLYNRI